MNTGESPVIRISDTAENSAQDCSKYILSTLQQVKNGPATLAISGGSTPRAMFIDMARADFDWSHVHIFWVDERCVPPADKESNFRLADETLLTPARVPVANIHRIRGEDPPAEAAAQYVAEIQKVFQLRNGALPAFDVLHRGMGPDAHTASLFPGSPLVQDRTGIATNVWVEKMKMDRITLLPGVLFAAKHTVLQVAGEEKADALQAVLHDPEDFLRWPCQIASRDNRAVWFLDKAAASKL